MHVRANGLLFHVRLEGPEDRPVLTLSHALATTLEMWEPQMPALARRYRVLRYDMRGHGRSDAPPPPYDIDQLADDVVGLWDALGIARSHVVGLSIGGKIGLSLALRHPQRLGGVVLCNSTSRIPAGSEAIWDQRIRQVEAGGLETQVETTLQRWFTEAFRRDRPEVVARIAALIRATPPQGFIGASRAIQAFDATDRLAGIRTPLLLLPGEKDPGTPPALSETIHRLVPGAQWRQIAGASHLSNIERAEAVTEAILDFLAGLDGRDPPAG